MLEILSDLKISNCETRHCSVVSVGCPFYSDTQLIDSWQLWRGRAGDALDSVRQDRHYAREVALVTSVMVVILPPIWKLLSLISFINLLFSLVISLKVRRERTQYPRGVANLRFNYLRCFSINFENCCAHLAANFLYFPNIPNFLYLDGFEETYGQKTKNIGNQKNAHLSKSWYLTFFDDEISKLFFHSYGPRIPKWNFAHHLWSKQAQNIRKTPQNTWFTDPCFKSLQTGHPVEL